MDTRYALVERYNHRINPFGVSNTLFPPQELGPGGAAAALSALMSLQPVHQRLDPNSPAAKKAWPCRDVWGMLLVPYALLL